MINLTTTEFGIIFDILGQWNGQYYAFGSRTKSINTSLSDFDICFKDNIPKELLSKINDDFVESDLPFKVDLVDFNKISDEFRDTIKNDLVILPKIQIVKLNANNDWTHYHVIKKKEIFDNLTHIIYDPDHPCYSRKTDHHFLQTVDDKPVGILHVQLRQDKTAILRSIGVDSEHRNKGYAGVMMQFCHRWLKERHYHEIYLHSRPNIVAFYKHYGYKENISKITKASLKRAVDMARWL